MLKSIFLFGFFHQVGYSNLQFTFSFTFNYTKIYITVRQRGIGGFRVILARRDNWG